MGSRNRPAESFAEHSWLDGPIGNTRIIGKGFFEGYARDHGLEIVEGLHCGLMKDFSVLFEDSHSTAIVAPAVQDFYEHTSAYNLDVGSNGMAFSNPSDWLSQSFSAEDCST